MTVLFDDKKLEAFISDARRAGNRFKKYARDKEFYTYLIDAINTLYSVDCTFELKQFSYLHYEQLKHQDKTIGSIHIMHGRVERLIFEEIEDGIKIIVLELNNDHYGNKK